MFAAFRLTTNPVVPPSCAAPVETWLVLGRRSHSPSNQCQLHPLRFLQVRFNMLQPYPTPPVPPLIPPPPLHIHQSPPPSSYLPPHHLCHTLSSDARRTDATRRRRMDATHRTATGSLFKLTPLLPLLSSSSPLRSPSPSSPPRLLPTLPKSSSSPLLLRFPPQTCPASSNPRPI
jgi:hypothetical protein